MRCVNVICCFYYRADFSSNYFLPITFPNNLSSFSLYLKPSPRQPQTATKQSNQVRTSFMMMCSPSTFSLHNVFLVVCCWHDTSTSTSQSIVYFKRWKSTGIATCMCVLLCCRHFKGTRRARDLLFQGNLSQFDLLLEDIKDPSNHPRNYFMEACKYIS